MDAMKVVYLAGGMKKEWRQQVKKRAWFAIYLDPTESNMIEEADYTAWDLAAVQKSDIVFGYYEKDNPSGLGLMIELGVAWAAGKTIIFVDDKPDMRKYTGMARQMAKYVFSDLDEAINFLISML